MEFKKYYFSRKKDADKFAKDCFLSSLLQKRFDNYTIGIVPNESGSTIRIADKYYAEY